MIVRKDMNGMRASKMMQQRVKNSKNIFIHWNTETLDILGNTEAEPVILRNHVTGDESTLSVSAFFVAIGHKPNSDLFHGWLNLDEDGYIVTQPNSTKTSVPGVFAAGDIQDKIFRQAITASGSGCMAALEAERYLSIFVQSSASETVSYVRS